MAKVEDTLFLDDFYTSIGLKLSTKHCISEYVGIFAENLCYRTTENRIAFLDIVKLRLLNSVPSTWQSEHRSAILGKASQLAKIAGWFPLKSYQELIPMIFKSLFHREYNQSFTWIERIIPLGLKPSYGGLDFPGEYSFDSKALWIIETILRSSLLPIEKYVQLASISKLNCSFKKGDEPSYLEIFNSLSNYFKDSIIPDEVPEDLNSSHLYTEDQILKWFKTSKNLDIPWENISFWDDSSIRKETFETYGIMNLYTIVEFLDRTITFNRLLTRDDITPKDNTFFRFINKSKKLWKGLIKGKSIPSDYKPNQKFIDYEYRKSTNLYFVYTKQMIKKKLTPYGGPSLEIKFESLYEKNKKFYFVAKNRYLEVFSSKYSTKYNKR